MNTTNKVRPGGLAMTRGIVTPRWVSMRKREIRECAALYREARAKWIALVRAGAPRSGRGSYDRVTAAYAALAARDEMKVAQRRLAGVLRSHDIVLGGAMCEDARERAVRAGRLGRRPGAA